MANRTQFYSDGATIYGASDFIAPFDKMTTSGIINGYQVTAPKSGMTVNVAAGSAVLNGILTTDDTAQSVTIPTNTGGSARTDIIVLQIDTTAMETTVKDVPGTSTPAANQILLAKVTVPASASSIVSGNIDSSRRVYAGMANPFGDVTDAAAGFLKSHIQFSRGVLIQSGTVTVPPYPTLVHVDYPIAFDDPPVTVATMEAVPPASISIAIPNTVGFSCVQGGSLEFRAHWIAIGHKAQSFS